MASVAPIPATMKAVITQADKTIAVQDVPVPTIDDDEVLVQNVAIAQNPTDWKAAKYLTTPGSIAGVDHAGIVAKVGKAVTTFSPGDRVAGFVQGGKDTDRGAFAQYAKEPAELVWKIPEGTISDEEAATLGCGLWTAVQALYNPTRLALVEPPEKTTKEEWLFIYGGSTSVGMYAIQLAHHSGYKVATVASPKHHPLLKSYGADVIVDYRDPDAPAKIKQATNDSIHAGLDTISEGDSQSFSVKVFGSGPGTLVLLLGPDLAAQSLRPDVKLQSTVVYTTLGREFTIGTLFPPSPTDRKHMVAFLKKFPDLIKSGALKPNPVKLFEGGLAAVHEGFEYMVAGKNSGEKIVFRV